MIDPKQAVQWESNIIMNLSLEKVFQLRTLLYMQKLVHFNSVSYIDKTRIAALSGLHLHSKAFTTLSR